MAPDRLTDLRLDSSLQPQAVFIVDDDYGVRRAVTQLVQSAGLEAIGFHCGQAFLQSCGPGPCGCLVLDVNLPGITGLRLQEELAQRGIELPMIFLTVCQDVGAAAAAMRGGAVDFIVKPFERQRLLDRVHEGLSIDYERQLARLSEQRLDARLAALTSREREIMKLLAAGKSAKRIAAMLGIRAKTVDNHRAKVLQKLDVDNAAQLANLILQAGRQPRGPRRRRLQGPGAPRLHRREALLQVNTAPAGEGIRRKLRSCS